MDNYKPYIDKFPKKDFYPGQKEALIRTVDMITRNKKAVLRAPPGVGKSPILYAILSAGEGGGLIITHLNPLIDQINEDKDLNVAVLKGRKQYTCNYYGKPHNCSECNVRYRLNGLKNLCRNCMSKPTLKDKRKRVQKKMKVEDEEIKEALRILEFPDDFFPPYEEIKSKHTHLVKENHPDWGGNEETMKEINAAYTALTDSVPVVTWEYKTGDVNILDMCKDCKIFQREDCRSDCEHIKAKEAFALAIKSGEVAVTNFDLFLLTDIVVDVLAVDECQHLPEKIEESYTVDLRKKGNTISEQFDNEIELCDREIKKLKERLNNNPHDTEASRKRNNKEIKKIRLSKIKEKYERDPEKWISYLNPEDGKTYVRPFDGFCFINEIENRCNYIIFSSATPNVPEGYEKYRVRIPHPFPWENRKIIFCPVCKFDSKHREQNKEEMASKISQLVQFHGGKAIVHCHSYNVAESLDSILEDSQVQPRNTEEDPNRRKKSLEDWKNNDVSIFLSVNMREGIDLQGEEFYLNIIPVVPWQVMGDPAVKKKKKIDPKSLYKEVAIRIQQATGRCTRSATDKSITYILDSNFGRFYKENRDFFENWFKEALWSKETLVFDDEENSEDDEQETSEEEEMSREERIEEGIKILEELESLCEWSDNNGGNR